MNKKLKFILSPLIIPTAFAQSAKNSKVMRVLLYLYLFAFVLTSPLALTLAFALTIQLPLLIAFVLTPFTLFLGVSPLPLSIHLLFFLHRVMMKVINEE